MRAGDEVTDLLVEVSPETGERLPVKKADVLAKLEAQGDHRAATLVEQFPTIGGDLDPDFVDRFLVVLHCEIQRLSEEFRHGARMADLLNPIVSGIRGGADDPLRIVDIGCGTGYVTRWLAANAGWHGVDVVGVDFNPALIDEARCLAEEEGLRCSFEVGDAFRLAGGADVLISTGLMHHLRGEALTRFFEGNERLGVGAFVHVDFQPSRIAPLGSWMFHRTRMRLAIARLDGVRSAVRAHPLEELTGAAVSGAPGHSIWLFGRKVHHTPFPCVLSTLIGVRRDLVDVVRQEFGSRASRFEVHS